MGSANAKSSRATAPGSLAALFSSTVFAGLLFFVSAANAQLIIDVGNIPLTPGASGQQVSIFLRNDGAPVQAAGLDLVLEIGDGGPDAGGTIDGPDITGVNLASGIFGPNNLGVSGDPANTGQLQFWTTASNPGPMVNSGDNLLAIITFDATGFGAGSGPWDFKLIDTHFGDTVLNDPNSQPLSVTINNGSIAVPEPSQYAAAGGIICLLWAAFRRRRSRHSA
jgi:hypothetical protein